MRDRVLFPKPVLDETLLLESVDRLGIPRVHAKTLWRYLIQQQHPWTELESIPQLPKRFVQLLRKEFTLWTTRVVERKESSDGSATKLLVELQDGQRVETVLMRYGSHTFRSHPSNQKETSSNTENLSSTSLKECSSNQKEILSNGSEALSRRPFKSQQRTTVCVSSQVGCAMGCRFCATGTMGRLGQLHAGEILEQVLHAAHSDVPNRLRNVVFMGMGEPLDNYRQVQLAVQGMTDRQRFALSPARITVSTVGVVPRLLQMADDMPDIRLALSLHAPTQDLRLRIVPTAQAYNVERLMAAADIFVEKQSAYRGEGKNRIIRRRKKKNVKEIDDEHGFREQEEQDENFDESLKEKLSKVMVEYVLIGPDLNCSDEVAHALGRLLSVSELRLRSFLLNVIPYNPTESGSVYGYTPPTQDQVNEFVSVVREYGVTVLVRQELGQDVQAACGQLVVKKIQQQGEVKEENGQQKEVTDMEDLLRAGSKGRSQDTLKRRARTRRASQQKVDFKVYREVEKEKMKLPELRDGMKRLLCLLVVLLVVRWGYRIMREVVF